MTSPLVIARRLPFICLLFVLLLQFGRSYAINHITIHTPFNDTLLCKGMTYALNVTCAPPSMPPFFRTANVFKAELSDASGSFASPTVIGTVNADVTSFIVCTIPTSIPSGTGYRIRVVTTDSAEVSPDNGKNIRISDYPSFTVSNNGPICAGKPANLACTLSAATSTLSPLQYQWQGPSFSSNVQNPSIASVPVTGGGYYLLTVTYYGCARKDSTLMNVIPAPTSITIRSNNPVCQNQDLNLLSDCPTCPATGTTFSWVGPFFPAPNNSQNILIKKTPLSVTGKYVLTVNALGCVIKDSINILVRPQPDTPKIQTNSPVCLGDTVKLYGTSKTAGVMYEWTGPSGFASNLQNNIIPNATFGNKGFYNLITYLNGCPSVAVSDSVLIGTPLSKPTIINNLPIVCPHDSIVLTANGAGSQQGRFDWTGPGGSAFTGKSILRSDAKPTMTGYYTVVQKLNGCISLPDSTYVEVPEVPKPVVSATTPVCFGQPLNLHIETVSATNATYQWAKAGGSILSATNDASINAVSYNDSGKYVGTIFLNGCKDTSTVKIKVSPLPVLNTVTSNSPVCDGDSLKLSAKANSDTARFVWTGPNNFTSNMQYAGAPISFNGAGKYYVKAITGACLSLPDSVEVAVKEKPAPTTASCNTDLKQGGVLYLSSFCPTPGVTYTWTGPANYTSNKQNDTLKEIVPAQTGSYIVSAHYNGCITSALVIAVIPSISESRFQVYPNPNNGRFTVRGDLDRDEYIPFEVVSMQGKLLFRGEVVSVKNAFKIDIDLGNPPTGIYLLHMRVGGRNKTIGINVRQ
ncbi:MAG: T9SS type A sorting domain-containing protein [Bacteroidetes bacterium]|nr:T9SS type A sorting domain-containing protein [Bacteroidota bacterium]